MPAGRAGLSPKATGVFTSEGADTVEYRLDDVGGASSNEVADIEVTPDNEGSSLWTAMPCRSVGAVDDLTN